MLKKLPKLKLKRIRLFGSIRSKLTLIVLAMGIATVIGSALVITAFGRISHDMDVLSDERVPALKLSSELVATSGEIKNAMNGILLVETETELSKAGIEANAAIDHLVALIDRLPKHVQDELEKDRLKVQKSAEELISARNANFRNRYWITSQMQDLQKYSTSLQKQLTQLVENREVKSDGPAAPSAADADAEAAYLLTLLDIEKWLSLFQSEASNVVFVTGVFETINATGGLAEAARALETFVDFEDGLLAEDLRNLAALAHPTEGLPAFKTASLQSNATAIREAVKTAETVLHISKIATSLGEERLTEISQMASLIRSDLKTSEEQIYMQLAGAAVVLVVAMLVTQFLILRPLRQINGTTERLARGDLREVTGFDRAPDEIARIAAALSVFRDGLVERQEMAETANIERAERAAEQKQAVDAIAAGLERLSTGDLSQPIQTEMSDGYVKLRDDFNSAQDNLRDTLAQVVQSVSSIRNGSAEINSATQNLSHRTESQAATLEETAAALDEMTNSVRESARAAGNVESTMQQARENAQQSGEIVRTAVSAMNKIDESSTEISSIVSVIDDIAFQTNLLALNAGVEAARAGDSGKGFAVVAAEVRALAQRSAESAKEIKSLITNSSSQVEQGVELVGKTGDALQSILDQFGEISALVSGIAKVTAEQSAGLNEINTGIVQLDRVTQQNASMVEQTTHASQSLDIDANRMADLAGRFEISRHADLDPQADDTDTVRIAVGL